MFSNVAEYIEHVAVELSDVYIYTKHAMTLCLFGGVGLWYWTVNWCGSYPYIHIYGKSWINVDINLVIFLASNWQYGLWLIPCIKYLLLTASKTWMDVEHILNKSWHDVRQTMQIWPDVGFHIKLIEYS